jgi:dipeptidyl aminopeptidase/acylaminoacyl peptidase
VEFLRVPVGDGENLDGWLVKPRGFNPAKKYPLIVYVYGEPASTTAVDWWQGKRGLFDHALAAEGYLVASFDNRGTPARRKAARGASRSMAPSASYRCRTRRMPCWRWRVNTSSSI